MYIKAEDAEVTNWNPRTEKHGEEKIMAGDISIRVNLPVEILSEIAVDKVDFRKFMYKGDGELKSLCLEPLKFHREFDDMEMTLELGEDNVLSLAAEKVKDLVAKVEAGYRVTLSLKVQVQVDERASGELHGAAAMSGVGIELQKGGKQMDLEDKDAAAA
jgi:hypothetical protein